MNEWIIYSIGFTAQLLFSARLLIQWITSEKNRRVITPASFWMHSLAASFLLFTYGYLRNDFPIILGQVITYYIYIRNLQFEGRWYRQQPFLQWALLLFPVVVIFYFFNNQRYDLAELFNGENISYRLLVWGSTGQVIFTARFVYQWIYAEKTKRPILPSGFWLLSIIGSVMILSYAVIRKDPVLVVGQLFGFFIYTRNIILIMANGKA